MKRRWIGDNYHVSEFNFVEDVTRELGLPSRVVIADCTLRDGEQQAGIVFTKEDKVNIARKLDELRVPQIEAGMPAASEEDKAALKAIVGEGLEAKVYGLARLIKSDVDKIVECGAWGVLLSAPAGYLKLQHSLRWSEDKMINTALELIDYSKQHGLWVDLSPTDTVRASLDFVRRYLGAVIKDGRVDRVRVVDTAGSSNPQAMSYLVKEMKRVIGSVPLEVHCHNDLGLATANCLAAITSGAEVASTTVNGIGERCGNTAMEEVVLALRLLYGVDTGLRLEKLYEVSKLVEELSGVTLQRHKPVVGWGAFAHEAGVAVAGVISNPFTGESYSPELVGRKRRIVLGKKSGRTSIQYKLNELGVTPSEEDMERLLERIKRESVETKSYIPDKRFEAIIAEMGLRRPKEKASPS